MTPSHTPRVGWLATLGRHMGVWLAAALCAGVAGAQSFTYADFTSVAGVNMVGNIASGGLMQRG